jgi:hypothetical protein
MFYVLFDSENAGYMKNPYAANRHAAPNDGKLYKRLGAAIAAASLANVGRNVPPGLQPSKHYSNRPQVEIHEIDLGWNIVAVHAAPPSYIFL